MRGLSALNIDVALAGEELPPDDPAKCNACLTNPSCPHAWPYVWFDRSLCSTPGEPCLSPEVAEWGFQLLDLAPGDNHNHDDSYGRLAGVLDRGRLVLVGDVLAMPVLPKPLTVDRIAECVNAECSITPTGFQVTPSVPDDVVAPAPGVLIAPIHLDGNVVQLSLDAQYTGSAMEILLELDTLLVGQFVRDHSATIECTETFAISPPSFAGDHTLTVVVSPLDSEPCTFTASNVRIAVSLKPADLNGDGRVDAIDLATLLGNWSGQGVGDIDASGLVGAADLALLLGAWDK